MSGMYENILPQNQRKHRSGKPLIFLLVALAVAVLAACVLPVGRTMLHQYHYKQFISQLSQYTTQTYYKDTLQAQVDGQTFSVSGDNAYGVFNIIAAMGPCLLSDRRPDQAPDAALTYGDSTTMDLWDVDLSDSDGRSRGIYVEFHSPELDFSYLINRTDMDYMMIYLAPENNSAAETTE